LCFQFTWYGQEGENAAKPFEWKFTRNDLAALLSKCPTANRVAA